MLTAAPDTHPCAMSCVMHAIHFACLFCDSQKERRLLGHGITAVLLLEVGLLANGVGLDGLLAGVPVGGADLAVLLGELEGVDETDSLVDAAADGKVVDGDLQGRIVSSMRASGTCACIADMH